VPSYAEQLIRTLDRTPTWPRQEDHLVWGRIALWTAMRESDRAYLAAHSGRAVDRYMVDPLPEKISGAYADLVAGAPPTIEAANEGDQDQYDAIAKENALDHLFHAGVDTQVSEGGVWWRIYVDREVADWPLIDLHSRMGVVRLFAGRRLRSVGFFTRLDDPSGNDTVAWRHLEVHEQGRVVNLLYRGADHTLGRKVSLRSHPDVETLRDEWKHDLPMLAGWIPNKLDLAGREGVSEYASIEDMLLELNESLETGKSNRRLVARKRVVVPASAVDSAGDLDPEREAIVMEQADLGDNQQSTSPLRVLEYSFDADALITYQNDLAVKALTRVGIAAEFIGIPTAGGFAESGTALRLRLIPSTNAGRGKRKPWLGDSGLAAQLHLCARVANLPVDQGGYGTSFAQLDEPPAVDVPTELPEDPVERTGRVSQAVTARVMSRRQAVAEQHPEWTEDQVNEEVEQIQDDMEAERPATAPAGGVRNIFDGRTAADRGTPPEDDPEAAPADVV